MAVTDSVVAFVLEQLDPLGPIRVEAHVRRRRALRRRSVLAPISGIVL
jgi:hypothetical protein